MLGLFVFLDHPPDTPTDLADAVLRAGAAPDIGDDLVDFTLGGAEQILALAGAFGTQHRVHAGDEALAGEVEMAYFAKVTLVEQRTASRRRSLRFPCGRPGDDRCAPRT